MVTVVICACLPRHEQRLDASSSGRTGPTQLTQSVSGYLPLATSRATETAHAEAA